MDINATFVVNSGFKIVWIDDAMIARITLRSKEKVRAAMPPCGFFAGGRAPGGFLRMRRYLENKTAEMRTAKVISAARG
jgi:hypothetical protein